MREMLAVYLVSREKKTEFLPTRSVKTKRFQKIKIKVASIGDTKLFHDAAMIGVLKGHLHCKMAIALWF